MKNIELPVLDFGPDADVIRTNSQIIEEFKIVLKAALKSAEGLHQANQAFCKHEDKKAEYDPAYAGGGFSNYYCPTCGSTRC